MYKMETNLLLVIVLVASVVFVMFVAGVFSAPASTTAPAENNTKAQFIKATLTSENLTPLTLDSVGIKRPYVAGDKIVFVNKIGLKGAKVTIGTNRALTSADITQSNSSNAQTTFGTSSPFTTTLIYANVANSEQSFTVTVTAAPLTITDYTIVDNQ
jgi:hypothetical protein